MAILTELKYWKDGTLVLPDNNANMQALKYWSNGAPYVIAYGVAEPPATVQNAIFFGTNF